MFIYLFFQYKDLTVVMYGNCVTYSTYTIFINFSLMNILFKHLHEPCQIGIEVLPSVSFNLLYHGVLSYLGNTFKMCFVFFTYVFII